MRQAQREWLGRVLAATDKTLSELAVAANVSDTTLTRFYNDPRHTGVLSTTTVQAVSDATGVLGPGAVPGNGVSHEASEDAHPVRKGELAEEVDVAIANLIAGRQDAHPWRMRTDVLALAGIRIGDILIVDQRERPRDGDVVCAQVEIGYGAKTVFRLLQTPNLIAAGFDPAAIRPEVVDNARVRIAGVMTDLIRRPARS